MIAIGFELKRDIADLADKIQKMRIDVYDIGAEAARAIVAVKDLGKRVAALESDKRAA